MKIYLQGGPFDGETYIIGDHERQFRIDGSVYNHTTGLREGSSVFVYDEKASRAYRARRTE